MIYICFNHMHDGSGRKRMSRPRRPFLPSPSSIGPPPGSFHSSSNRVSSISGKSSSSDTLISSPQASRCNVFSFGFLVLPDTTFSTVLCVMPDSVASLLTVIHFFSISSFSRPLIASEYVMPSGTSPVPSLMEQSICHSTTRH